MKVLVTGATGWIGSALVPDLVAAGHQVLGLVRSDRSADAVTALGATPVRGDLTDPDTVRAAAAGTDGVVHLAFDHDLTRFADAVADDAALVRAVGDALAGTGAAFVAASGTPVVPGRVATEADAGDDGDGPAAARYRVAQDVVALAGRGVRSSVVRLPRSVHGEGDRHGLVPMIIAAGRERGVAAVVGDGSQRWPAVHRLDAARLFRLALESAPAGSVLHAVGDEGVALGELAQVVGRGLDLPVTALDAAELGFLGAVMADDQPASAARTRELLGWEPTHPGLLDDVARHYL